MDMTVLLTLSAALLGAADGILLPSSCGNYVMDTLYGWSQLRWDSANGTVTSKSAYTSGLTAYGDTLYVSVPQQYGPLHPTLFTVPVPKGLLNSFSPSLQPYPNNAWNTQPTNDQDCSTSLVSVHRTATDKCGRLWVLDSGVTNGLALASPTRVCQPKIVIFNTTNSALVRVIPIPESALRPNSLVQQIVLDETSSSSSCDDLYAYIADTGAPSIIVMYLDRFWSVSSPWMYPDPNYQFIVLNGEPFPFFHGIDGLDFDDTNVYFQPVASKYIFSISRQYVRSGPYPGDDVAIPVNIAKNKTSGGIGLRVDDSTKCLLYNPISSNIMSAYNPQDNTTSTLVYDPRIAVIYDIAQSPSNGNVVYILSVQYPRYLRMTVSGIEPVIYIFRLTKLLTFG